VRKDARSYGLCVEHLILAWKSEAGAGLCVPTTASVVELCQASHTSLRPEPGDVFWSHVKSDAGDVVS